MQRSNASTIAPQVHRRVHHCEPNTRTRANAWGIELRRQPQCFSGKPFKVLITNPLTYRRAARVNAVRIVQNAAWRALLAAPGA